MLKPDYDNSIVNLMSSILGAFGKKNAVKGSRYKELEQLPSKELKDSKNIILMVLDGLGYNYFVSKNSILQKNLKGKITSVFPPTTATAITTFMTGTAPQQHAITGWFIFLKEIGVVAKILPFKPRFGGEGFTSYSIKVEEILDAKCISEKIKASTYVVQHKNIFHSSYSLANSKRAKNYSYTTFSGFLKQTKKIIRTHNKRKFVYAYWPMFDTLCHKYGVKSKSTLKHFKEMEKKLSAFIKSIKGTNTALIITADHGLVDTPKEKIVRLEDHPKLKECLVLPLCGDSRTIYCYVHPSKTKQFENYIKTKLSKYCEGHKNHELIKNNYYGLFEADPRLAERIGDYVLIMKDNYIFKDTILSQKRTIHIGNHGGLSADELFVPLLVFNR